MKITQLRTLKGEIALTAYSGKSDQEICAILNDASIETHRPVAMATIQDWASSKRIVKRFFDKSLNGSPLYEELQTLLRGKQESANLKAPVGAETLFVDLVAADILTTAEVAELQALGRVMISRAEELGLGYVYARHIVKAREV